MKRQIALAAALLACAAHGQHLTVPADTLDATDAAIGRGHDVAKLMAAAMKFKPKSEFESAADFAERATRFGEQTVYGSVRLAGKVALNVGLIESHENTRGYGYKYDADAGQLSVCAPTTGLRYITAGQSTYNAEPMWLWKKVVKNGSYVGRNAFGVRVNVQKQILVGARVLVPVGSYRSNCAKSIEMPSAEARRVVYGASLILVGRFTPPFGERYEDLDKATIDDPIEQVTSVDEAPFLVEEVVLVSRGAIVYRQPAPEPKVAY